MTRAAEEKSIQSIIVSIFKKKNYHLEVFFKKLSHVFIDYQGCIWIYEID